LNYLEFIESNELKLYTL